MKAPTTRVLLAALAFGLASGPANAVIDLSPASGTDFAPWEYAKETVSKADDDSATHNGVTYYEVHGEDGNLDFSFISGILVGGTSGTRDTALLYITLTNMAFKETVSANVNNANRFTLASGGQAGDTTALLRYTSADDLAATEVVTIDVGDLNEMLVTSAHKGGITVELINATLEGILGTGKARTKHTREGAVVGVSGVSAKIRGSDATATVASGFTGFDAAGMEKTASLGSVELVLNTTAKHATGADAVERTDMYVLDATQTPTSMLKLKGDLSFADTVALHASAACGTSSPPTMSIDEDTMASASIAVGNNFGGANNNTNNMKYICITAKDEMVIPRGPYTVDIDYAGATGNFLSPIADVTDAAFGSILHDGTTINIPYVTTAMTYNQRFMIVNNGAATTYAFTFTPESGITATAGTMASGVLPMGTTHLRASDIVTLTGGSRTAATFTAVARKTNIEMSSVLAVRETGATDLSVLNPE